MRNYGINVEMNDPIRRYMERKGIRTQSEFARLVDLSPQYICDLLSGRCNLGRGGARKIQAATGGLLTIQELLSWDWVESSDGKGAA